MMFKNLQEKCDKFISYDKQVCFFRNNATGYLQGNVGNTAFKEIYYTFCNYYLYFR